MSLLSLARTVVDTTGDEITTNTLEDCTAKTDKSPVPLNTSAESIHDVPCGCLGPSVCIALGICGRISCLVGGDHDRFAGALAPARALNNPHRVPDEFMDGDSDLGDVDGD